MNSLSPLDQTHFVRRLAQRAKSSDVNFTVFVFKGCEMGNLALIEYLHQGVGLTTDDFGSGALNRACGHGHLDVVRYLHVSVGLSTRDAVLAEAPKEACENGHLTIIEYLHRHMGMTAEHFCQGHSTAVAAACQQGQLTSADFANQDRAVTAAQQGGHTAVLEYLRSEVGLSGIALVHSERNTSATATKAAITASTTATRTAENTATIRGISALDETTLKQRFEEKKQGVYTSFADFIVRACQTGNVALLDYIHCNAPIKVREALLAEAALHACANGHTAVVEYLHRKVGLKMENFRYTFNRPLKAACQGGHLDVVRYLHRDVRLTVADFADNEAPLTLAAKGGHMAVLEYLHSEVGLRPENTFLRDVSAAHFSGRSGGNTGIGSRALTFLSSRGWLSKRELSQTLLDACRAGNLDAVIQLHQGGGVGLEDLDSPPNVSSLAVLTYLHTEMHLTPAHLGRVTSLHDLTVMQYLYRMVRVPMEQFGPFGGKSPPCQKLLEFLVDEVRVPAVQFGLEIPTNMDNAQYVVEHMGAAKHLILPMYRNACNGANLALLRYLWKSCPVQPMELSKAEALERAVRHLTIIKVLHMEMNVTKEAFEAGACRHASDLEVIKYLHEVVGCKLRLMSKQESKRQGPLFDYLVSKGLPPLEVFYWPPSWDEENYGQDPYEEERAEYWQKFEAYRLTCPNGEAWTLDI